MTSVPDKVDFHCHLDLYPDLAEAIAACERSRTATLAVTTTPKAFRRNMQFAKGAEFVRVALGLHPHLAEERRSELPLFEALLPETRYVGEVGLDAGPRFYRSMAVQEEVFSRILRMCAASGDKILSVHSVRAAGRVLDHLDAYLPPERGRVVFHWFSGSRAEAERAAKRGCYFSVNQAMLEKDRGRDLVASLPRGRIITETDGPFLEMDNGPIHPGDVIQAVQRISDSIGVTREETGATLVRNWINLVSWKP